MKKNEIESSIINRMEYEIESFISNNTDLQEEPSVPDNIEYEILIFAKELVEKEENIPEWAEFFARKGNISVEKATELITKFLKL